MKNLLISPIGDNSLYYVWLKDKPNFDIYLIYYGDDEQKSEELKCSSNFFVRRKGTKFNIVKKLFQKDPNFFKQYDYVFIPDDDLYLITKDINRIFELANKHELQLCQPSIIGYYDVPITLNVPSCVLRYTNFVEVMCPCFSKEALEKCVHSFDHSVSCWGIDIWWHSIMEKPQDKFAILDDVIAIHTRKCFGGEYYKNNQIYEPWNDLKKLIEQEDLSENRVEYNRIWKNIVYKTSGECFYPNTPFVKNLCETLRKKWTF
jgi:hypothetical protein